jgi:hypothetical protein
MNSSNSLSNNLHIRSQLPETSAPHKIHFSAQTEKGMVSLSIVFTRHIQQNIHSIESQLVLSKIERQIRLVEDWLGVPLELRWSELPPDARPVATLIDHSKTDFCVEIYLPIECFNDTVDFTFPEHLPEFELDWLPFSAKLSLGKTKIPDNERASLTVGATVLIPESYSEQWDTYLYLPGPRVQTVGTLSVNEMSWHRTGEFQPHQSSHVGPEAHEFAIYCHFTLDLLLRESVQLNESLTAILAEKEATFHFQDDMSASGFLVPVGGGMGFRIERLNTPVLTAEQ